MIIELTDVDLAELLGLPDMDLRARLESMLQVETMATEPPEALSTADDYAAAPLGTIVAEKSADTAAVKIREGVWGYSGAAGITDAQMGGLASQVLCWGYGNTTAVAPARHGQGPTPPHSDQAPTVVRLDDRATLPTRAHDSDAGWDLYANANLICRPGETIMVHTGVAIAVPHGQSGDVRSRSGLASRGIVVANAPGTIDPGYTGEVKVLIRNDGRTMTKINRGDRIAQLVFTHINTTPLVVVDQLEDSPRGDAGFGSTGI